MPGDFHQNWDLRKPAVTSKGGLVAAHNLTAAEIGAAVLADGGNAFDAAIATSLAMSVVEPWMSGIGGGGFGLICDAAGGDVHALDYGMMASRHLDPADYPLAGDASDAPEALPDVVDDRNAVGPLSIAVPGLVAGLGLLHDRFATRPWADLVTPAVELAQQGLPVTWNTTLRITESAAALRRFEPGASQYLPDGLPPAPAAQLPLDRLPLGGLADTLARLAEAGAADFYRGDLAAALAADLKDVGARVAADDLSACNAVLRKPLAADHGPARVYAAPGLTAGPTLIDALARFAGDVPEGPPDAQAYMAWAGALAAAYARRFETMGHGGSMRHPGCTTHFSVVDKDGNLVAWTQTLLTAFGSKVVLPKTGVLMNNGVAWFDARPGRINSLKAGVRPLSNMCPAIALRDGKPWIATGASGGRRILPAVAQLLSMQIDGGLDLEAAFHTPRISVPGAPPVVLDRRLPHDVVVALAAAYPVREEQEAAFPRLFASPNAVRIEEDGTRTGMADVFSPVSGVAAG